MPGLEPQTKNVSPRTAAGSLALPADFFGLVAPLKLDEGRLVAFERTALITPGPNPAAEAIPKSKFALRSDQAGKYFGKAAGDGMLSGCPTSP
jgi:hypothetical protein